MEGKRTEERKRSKWADESEDEWTSEEEQSPKSPPREPLASAEPSQAIIKLQSLVESASPPYKFTLLNLPFKSTEKEILEFLSLTAQEQQSVKITISKNEEGKALGFASLSVDGTDTAYKVIERHDSSLGGRSIRIAFGEEKPRPKRGRIPRGTPRRGRNTRGNLQPRKIVITRSDNKPKEDPFGGAKPIDSRSKELEFEKKQAEKKESETKQPEEAPPKAPPKPVAPVVPAWSDPNLSKEILSKPLQEAPPPQVSKPPVRGRNTKPRRNR